MPKTKEFDCVRMKEDIQSDLIELHKGMTETEIREDELRRIKSSPILGPIYEEMTNQTKASE
ncbi:MAG: hypothetical protein KC944_22845 [Candidatus Omnitrophica bacterium]|nr:hypothetical protein [Candidatus Omnitrophota bacterium]MCA9439273.1 hypothetical protein [Candidatus Omnitrophota bacterium]